MQLPAGSAKTAAAAGVGFLAGGAYNQLKEQNGTRSFNSKTLLDGTMGALAGGATVNLYDYSKQTNERSYTYMGLLGGGILGIGYTILKNRTIAAFIRNPTIGAIGLGAVGALVDHMNSTK